MFMCGFFSGVFCRRFFVILFVNSFFFGYNSNSFCLALNSEITVTDQDYQKKNTKPGLVLPPNVRTGGRVYVNSPQQTKLQGSNPGLAKAAPVGKGLVNPDITQQIRNNMFVLLEQFKIMRSIGLLQSSKLEFQQALGMTNMPLDNLDVIMLLLKNSAYPEVQNLEQRIQAFMKEADTCLNMAAEPPSGENAGKIFDEKFAGMLTMAKVVIEACKFV